MGKIISGSTTMSLAKPDAGGNMGYSLSFNFKYQEDNPEDTIEYSNIEFSGPGTWDDYSEGDDYPNSLMIIAVLSGN